jgi:hypothetical protein
VALRIVTARLAAIVSAAALVLPGDGAQEASLVEGLLAEDARTLSEYLGEGVVGRPVAAPGMEDPSRWFPFESVTLTYRVTGGKDKGSLEEHVYRRVDDAVWGDGWSERVGDYQTVFLSRTPAGDIRIRGEITHDRHKMSLFSPGEPLIPLGMNAGETREERSDVKVYTLENPDHVKYSGSVVVTCTYLGAYEIHVPSGRYTAVLFKWTDDGKVGPAHVGETEYRFLAEGVGTVAQVVIRNVDAWLVYRSSLRIGKVLDATAGS